MKKSMNAVLFAALLLLFCSLSWAQPATAPKTEWMDLAEGVEYAHIPLFGSKTIADSLHVVRVDPGRARLVAFSSAEPGARSRTARQWCEESGLVAVLNAGMYDVDAKTHVGYMRTPAAVNNKRWSRNYESVLLLEGKSDALPSARLLDRSDLDKATLNSFGAVIQNLRLIKNPGVNVWQRQPRTWSEAAIAEDRSGNILLLFLRKPVSMYDFNDALLRSGLNVVRAMHAEGGPEASLSVCSEALDLDLAGSLDSGSGNVSDRMVQMAIPNIVGVKR